MKDDQHRRILYELSGNRAKLMMLKTDDKTKALKQQQIKRKEKKQ